MEKTFSSVLGATLSVLTLSGFVQSKKPKHLLGHMNVDTQHSVLRVPLTIALLYAASEQSKLKNTRTILSYVGIFYICMGIVGTINRDVGGTLPSRLTKFDLKYHMVVGALALWLGGRSGRMMK